MVSLSRSPPILSGWHGLCGKGYLFIGQKLCVCVGCLYVLALKLHSFIAAIKQFDKSAFISVAFIVQARSTPGQLLCNIVAHFTTWLCSRPLCSDNPFSWINWVFVGFVR